MMALKASVIVPTYRYPKIVYCLEALSKQDYPDYEVIIVDDGSDDGSVDVIKKFILRKKNFKLIVLPENSGPAHVRNKGVLEAKGDVVLFTDSDCIPYKTWISRMVEPFYDESVAGASGTYKTWNSESMIARFIGYEIALRHRRMAKRASIDFIGTFSAAYRKDVFLNENGFDEKFRIASGEDTDFSYKLSSKGYKMVFVKEAFVYHRHPDKVFWYLKQKLGRGFWRVRLYRKHISKVKGESYTPFRVLVQIPLFFVFVATALLSPFVGLVLPAVLFTVIFALNLFEGINMIRYEKKMLIVAPMLLTFRTVAAGLGVIVGIARWKF